MSRPLLLLVDDAPEMGVIVARLADRAGCDAEHRLDAESALVFLRDRAPDLVLLDVNLSGMSGPELCRRLRADPRTADLAVAVFTHEGLSDDVAAGVEAGADFLFSKDLVVSADLWAERLAEILETVRSQQEQRSLRSALDEAPFPAPADWISVLNGALRPPTLRGFAPPVVRALLRRALTRVFASPCTDRWLTADGCALDPERVPATAAPAAPELASALVKQVWCLTGTAASAPLRATLAAAFPGIPEPLTR